MSGPWRIKEFAGRTSVPEVTLRAWERRYGLLAPTRSPSGYRLYSADDERRVAAMRAHMSRGIAAGEAAQLVLAQDASPPGDLPGDPVAIVPALLDAVGGYDAGRVDALLGAAFALDRPTAIDEVLMPFLHAVGERWAQGTFTVAHEHFASHLVERRLLEHAGGWSGGAGPLALLACPAGERHTLGLMAFGVALVDRGWRVAWLGGDMPVGHVIDAAASLVPDLIVLAATDPLRLTDNAALIRALRARRRTVVAGAGATERVARSLGVERLTGDPAGAAAAL